MIIEHNFDHCIPSLDLHSLLLKACETGDLDQLLKLSYHFNTNVAKLVTGDVGFTHKTKFGSIKPGDYIYVTAESNYPEIVEQLIQLGGDPRKEEKGMTPLLIACQKGNLEVVKVLCSHGIELHPKGVSFKDAPIYHSCRHGHVDIMSYIIEQNPGVLVKVAEGDIGISPGLDYADIWAGLSKAVKAAKGLLIGNLLLYVGCIFKYLDIVKFLVSKGIGVNDILPEQTFYSALQTPLSAACKNNDFELAKFLLQQKAEITSSICNQYPEFTASLLKGDEEKYRRSYSISSIAKDAELTIENPSALRWDNKGLHKLHRHWLEIHSSSLCLLDIHENKITDLPIDFFELLANLEDLDLSMNLLTTLPHQGLKDTRLKRLIACRNNISSVPLDLFMNKNINIIDLSSNKIRYLPPDDDTREKDYDYYSIRWDCPFLKVLKLSNNALCCMPNAITSAVGLEKLILNNNMLVDFDVQWKCPLVELDISHNQLTEFTTMSQLVWSKTLHRLVLSYNDLKFIKSNICHLQNLQVLDLSYNQLTTLPPVNNWKCKILNKLILSHNKLTASSGPDGFYGVDKARITEAMSTAVSPVFNTSCEFPVELFSNSLQTLDISHNELENVPESVCFLTTLSELDLSCNPKLQSLPSELGKLKNVWNLRLNELNIPDIPFQLDGTNLSKKVLPFLRARLRKSVPFNRMKLMVVGLQGRGKTTLIATLQGKRLPANISTVGISVQQWSIPSPNKSYTFFWDGSETKEILFSSWDLAGQHVYYVTHQCFLTGKTLYLAVFNTTHGQEGVSSLELWLLNIQARAPASRVIIVGTHIDCLPAANRATVLERRHKDIYERYNKKGFPIISGCLFVSNVSGEGLQTLRDRIYIVADEMNTSGEHSMAGKMAPLSYIELYDSIMRENDRRKQLDLPPVLTIQEMLILAHSNKNNDIFDEEELIAAASFLHEHGVLLHFNDHLRELNTLFFIDPSWLCDMLAIVVTVRERNPFIKGGYIAKDALMHVLKNPRLPEKFIPQYLRLLERFEIVLCVDEENFLVPSMLPKERPGADIENVVKKYSTLTGSDRSKDAGGSLKNEYICRNYHMNYIPSGFWSRLIARIIVAVHKWGLIITSNTTNQPAEDKPTSDTLEVKYSSVFWREGILVSYANGYFLTESFQDEVEYEFYSNKGVAITVWSLDEDFSVMGFIVDHLDSLITEWYPGLEDVDACGDSLITKLIPCPTCSSKLRQAHTVGDMFTPLGVDRSFITLMEMTEGHFRNPQVVEQFGLPVCALAATSHKAILCSRHRNDPVPLFLVVPDLLLTDLPLDFVINTDKFAFEPSDSTRLGEGGAGGVYQAVYDEMDVAVKQFHSATKTKHFAVPYEDEDDDDVVDGWSHKGVFVPTNQTMQDQIEDGKVIRAFWDLRQEVAVLCRLQHPNVIKFIGVCHSPLCFVLELAPLGSLQGILEKLQVEREKKYQGVPTTKMCIGSVLGRVMTHNIALQEKDNPQDVDIKNQVARALAYLHECEIIYRDLKSDNVLVWSMDANDPINVKISDYGISAFATPQGVIGEGGTPGFQAPEIKVGCAYDEKVDIFSYGIWLYELISGYRPYREYRTAAEMKKAVSRGTRPSLLKDGIFPCLPEMEVLMEEKGTSQDVDVKNQVHFPPEKGAFQDVDVGFQECWHYNPVNRPSADAVVSRLLASDSLILHNTFPSQESSQLELCKYLCLWKEPNKPNDSDTSSDDDEPQLLLWCDEDVDRRYLIANVRKNVVKTNESCPGPRVLCAVNVDDYVWLGTEGHQLEVFGKMPDQQLPSILWKIPVKDHVMYMLTNQEENRTQIFASLANGTLLVFTKMMDDVMTKEPLFTEDTADVMQNARDEWSDPLVINLATQGLPAKCMVFTRDNSELWVSSGNMIVIINPSTYEILAQVKALIPSRSLIISMVTDGKSVWLTDRKSPTIYEWDIESRKKIRKFNCNQVNALGKNVLQRTIFSNESEDGVEEERVETILSKRIDKVEICKHQIKTVVEDEAKEYTISDEKLNESNVFLDVGHEHNTSVDASFTHDTPANTSSTGNTSIDASSSTDNSCDTNETNETEAVKSPENITKRPSRRSSSSVLDNFMKKFRRPTVTTDEAQDNKTVDQQDSTIERKPRSSSAELPNRVEQSDSSTQSNLEESNVEEVLTSSSLINKMFKRYQPSLMISKRSIKLKNESTQPTPNVDQNQNTVNDETRVRPRAAAWSGTTDRVTTLLFTEGTLWAGRESGDILVINVANEKTADLTDCTVCESEKSDLKNSYGMVIATVGSILKDRSNALRNISSLVHLPTGMIAALVRIEPRNDRLRASSAISKRTANTSRSRDKFQTLLIHSWTRDKFMTYQDRIQTTKLET